MRGFRRIGQILPGVVLLVILQGCMVRRLPTINATVVGPDGNPVTDAFIAYVYQGGRGFTVWLPGSIVRSDSKGRFQLKGRFYVETNTQHPTHPYVYAIYSPTWHSAEQRLDYLADGAEIRLQDGSNNRAVHFKAITNLLFAVNNIQNPDKRSVGERMNASPEVQSAFLSAFKDEVELFKRKNQDILQDTVADFRPGDVDIKELQKRVAASTQVGDALAQLLKWKKVNPGTRDVTIAGDASEGHVLAGLNAALNSPLIFEYYDRTSPGGLFQEQTLTHNGRALSIYQSLKQGKTITANERRVLNLALLDMFVISLKRKSDRLDQMDTNWKEIFYVIDAAASKI